MEDKVIINPIPYRTIQYRSPVENIAKNKLDTEIKINKDNTANYAFKTILSRRPITHLSTKFKSEINTRFNTLKNKWQEQNGGANKTYAISGKLRAVHNVWRHKRTL